MSEYPLEPSFQAFEKAFKCTLIVHVRKLVFKNKEGKPLYAPVRYSHRQLLKCDCGRLFDRSYCTNKYFSTIYSKIDSGKISGSFITRCKFGFVQIGVPLFRLNSHVATIYAGVWSRPLDKAHIRSVRAALEIFAKGALAYADEMSMEQPALKSIKSDISLFIANHFNEEISTTTLAKHLSLSVSRTCHLILELFGKNFSQLLLDARIGHAIFLLQNSDFRIKEIATKCGFQSMEHFSRSFRHHTGQSPRAFRKAMVNFSAYSFK